MTSTPIGAVLQVILDSLRIELVPIGYTLASLALSRENPGEQDWLFRRFHDKHDILRETPIYQEILREGLKRGRIEALRQASVEVVVERFPQLVRLTKEQVALIEDPEVLLHVLVKVSVAQNAEEAKKHLLTVDEAKESS